MEDPLLPNAHYIFYLNTKRVQMLPYPYDVMCNTLSVNMYVCAYRANEPY